MYVGGFQKFSTVDYPGELSYVIFLSGCPFKCPYCHNKDILKIESGKEYSQAELMADVLERKDKGMLTAVVFSGGEPLLQLDKWVDLAKTFKHEGLKIGIHTTGYDYRKMEQLVGVVDWVGMDIKAPNKKYKSVLGTDFIPDKVIELVKKFPSHQFRTTFDKDLLTQEDIESLKEKIPELIIQRCNK